ncbi:heavy metal-associated isoprenylated plant protein 32-like isoform X1 [Salvia hispanica]|uniref:heavy metal-associated isoprenylated plant protein 32-like isoform X1 n=1 Tax=Salvia hispanica TaxID=49212 RepID=UPI0020090362|nr:heavy metal-associated isoprenylated plant protein 32-like isoform X1 [Salvia hispanica]
MSKQDLLKVQTCVLRVNIHCEGCMHKVKKKLQKVEGVYKVSIDSEQGKVTVSGNADPASLIEKLEKAGKHAELWGPQKGAGTTPFPISLDQLKKFQIENLNKNNNQKNGSVQQLPFKKGVEKVPAKDHKSVRFELPEDDGEDDYDDDDLDEFDEEDDDFEDEFGEFHGKPPVKGAVGGGGGKKPSKGEKGGGKEGGKEKKKGGGGGGGIDMFIKGMLNKAGGKKKGKPEKSSKKKEGFELGDGKKGKNDDDGINGWSKKTGDNLHGGKQKHHNQQQQAFNEMKGNHKGGGVGGGGGRNMEMMGLAPMNNGGGFPGGGQGNPYSQQQQQYMAQMMMMNQMNQPGHEGAYHHPMAYARPPPPAHMGYGGPPQPMGYGYGPYGAPPPASGGYAHMFSDENTDSCSIM